MMSLQFMKVMKELLLKILVKIKKEVIQLNNLDTDKYFENMDSLLLQKIFGKKIVLNIILIVQHVEIHLIYVQL